MYNINANLVFAIEHLFDNAISAFQMNGSIEEWFRTTVGARQGCLLSPTRFNIFLERIMSDALGEHDRKVSISSGPSIKPRQDLLKVKSGNKS